MPRRLRTFFIAASFALALSARADGDPALDIRDLSTDSGNLLRVHGSTGSGNRGVPVAGGVDVDGDGHLDFAVAHLLASPDGVTFAGEVDLIFGDGTVSGTLDTAIDSSRILRIFGAQAREFAGSEIWMEDVDGDGLGDLLVCRQNYTAGTRSDAGALTILFGAPALRDLAAATSPVRLGTTPSAGERLTVVGAGEESRFCIWARTGDVDGDGVSDLLVGADTEDSGAQRSGAAYLIRGGNHLRQHAQIDLESFGTTAIAGQIARVLPAPATGLHFGATVQLGDLDGNGRAELLMAGTINRAGAALDGVGSGGSTDGTLFIAWDDAFPTPPWPAGYTLALDPPGESCVIRRVDDGEPAGSCTRIDGETANRHFSEELLGGGDYDGDAKLDLFVGDITGRGANGSASGIGYVFFDAAGLRHRDFDLQSPPPDLAPVTRIDGAASGDIAADTAAHGDFNGDGRLDLVITSPHASPLGRASAGSAHVLFGQRKPWPTYIDLANPPTASALRIREIHGALGSTPVDLGDTLGYSAAAADIDRDGLADLITNEMIGNGLGPDALDTGNLIIVSGAALATAPRPVPLLGLAAMTAFAVALAAVWSSARRPVRA